MKPIQPFFVFSTTHYTKGITMKRGIAHFYSYYQDASDMITISAVPDGCVDILLEKDSSGMSGRVCGTVLANTILDNKNDKEYFGVRFMPGILPNILDASMTDLVGNEIDFNDVIEDKDLLKRMEDAKSMQESIQIFLSSYDTYQMKQSIMNHHENIAKLVDWIKNEIILSSGTITIQELSDKTGYTTRYIDQIFNQEVGICPKTFSKIIKFQNVIQGINNNSSLSLTDLGNENGYYDQSHFIKDFKKFTALTPKEYRNIIKEREYNKRLEVIEVF